MNKLTVEPSPRSPLRLVPDDRSRPRVQRNSDENPHEAEMRTYARTIRAFREEEDGASDCAKVRPKLTLVYSRDYIDTSRITP